MCERKIQLQNWNLNDMVELLAIFSMNSPSDPFQDMILYDKHYAIIHMCMCHNRTQYRYKVLNNNSAIEHKILLGKNMD